jgi:hypothetical protein
MLLEVFLVLMLIATGSLILGYSTQTYFFSIFAFAILFFLGTNMMGLNDDEGVKFKIGEDLVSNYTYNEDQNPHTINSVVSSTSFTYDSYKNFLFGLIMVFISVMGIFIILMNTRSTGFKDD